jgi:PAS domain S-box-containing protein
MFDFVHPEDMAIAIRSFSEEVKMEPAVKFINIRLLRKDGNWTWCIVRGHNMLHNPYIGKMGIYFYDDTIRKQTEQALSESEKKLRMQATILTSVNDIIVTTDLDLRITSWNKVSEELTGIKEADILGRPAHEVIHYDFSPLTIDQVLSIIFDKGAWKWELQYELPDKSKLNLLYTISLVKDEEGKHIGLLAVGRDITKRK